MSSQSIGLALVLLALVGFGGLILYRATHRRHVPPALPTPAPSTPSRPGANPLVETEHEQLIRAILTVDGNATARMGDLKIFLFFLPFLWAVIWAILYAIYLAIR